jgi:SlyX protein
METDRLTTAESRIAWLEHHVAEQDKAMFELGEELRKLRRAMDSLRERLQGQGTPQEPPLPDERPPHY